MSETQNTPSNDKVAYSIVIVLLVVIAVLAYFLGQKAPLGGKNNTSVVSVDDQIGKDVPTFAKQPPISGLPGSHIEMIYIGCEEQECYSQENFSQLIEMNSFLGAAVQQLDVKSPEAQALVKEHGIRGVPVAILNTNNILNSVIQESLQPGKNGKFFLSIGNVNPNKSDNGFDYLSKDQLATLTANLNLYNNPKGDILWMEYSDLNCGYCRKQHNENVQESLFEMYDKKIAYSYTYFPIFNPEAPQAFECVLEQTDVDTWYTVIKKSYQNEFSTADQIASLVPTLDKTKFDSCINTQKYQEKITSQSMNGGMYKNYGQQGIFSITGTPGNVLINRKTGEYIFLNGAQPIEAFQTAIDTLLKL